jgi:hypothetical protein
LACETPKCLPGQETVIATLGVPAAFFAGRLRPIALTLVLGRDKALVVHDSIWVDLVHRYRFDPRPIIVHKLDTDPAVRDHLARIDYLVVPDWYLENPAGESAYPTLIEARKHAVSVARFGSGPDGVHVYRVSSYWSP